jgi:hypothetical protein
MAKNRNIQEAWPKVLPFVRMGEQTFFVDLRLRQFRTVGPPLTCIDFSSEEGKRMCKTANIVSCPTCETHIIIPGALRTEHLHCVNCSSSLR